jgi:HEAT repeat protein
VEALLGRLEHPDSGVRGAAAQALGALKDPRAVEPLLERLEDPDSGVRWATAGALGALKDPRAVEPLAKIALRKMPAKLLRAMLLRGANRGVREARDALFRLMWPGAI